MICPVTIFGVTCGAEIREGEGQLVMLDRDVYVVCPSCALRGVREADVAHAEPVTVLP